MRTRTGRERHHRRAAVLATALVLAASPALAGEGGLRAAAVSAADASRLQTELPPRTTAEAERARAWRGRFCTFDACGPRRADAPLSTAAFGALVVGAGLIARRRSDGDR